MRVIKSRAWIESQKLMLYPDGVFNFVANGKLFKLDPHIEQNRYFDTGLKIVELEFTGLLDKDNKEIFEGDIIEADSFNPSKYLIEFIEGGFCATGKNCSPIDINIFYPSNGCQIKVVGNNYETPIF